MPADSSSLSESSNKSIFTSDVWLGHILLRLSQRAAIVAMMDSSEPEATDGNAVAVKEIPGEQVAERHKQTQTKILNGH